MSYSAFYYAFICRVRLALIYQTHAFRKLFEGFSGAELIRCVSWYILKHELEQLHHRCRETQRNARSQQLRLC